MMYLIKLLVSAFLWTAISAKVIWHDQWINNNSPYKNGTEIEPPPNATYLNTVCPNGSGTLKIQCKDGGEEAFVDLQNNTVLHFFAKCDIHIGVLCNPWKGYNASCPDLLILFGCDVPDTTTGPQSNTNGSGSKGQGQIGNTTSGYVGTVGGHSNGTLPPVTGDPRGVNNKSGRKGNGGSKAVSSRWLIALVVAYGLFKISV